MLSKCLFVATGILWTCLWLANIVDADYNLVLYAAGLFENNTLASETYTSEIAQSGFQTVILWTTHVHTNADLIYNNYPSVSNGQLTPQYLNGTTPIKDRIAQLKSETNSTVNNVLFSIGSGGNPPNDFAHIVKIYQNDTLKQKMFNNFQVLLDLGIDGFDFDCEEFVGAPEADEPIIDVIVDMVGTFGKMGATIQTFVPFDAQISWNRCLEEIYKQNKKQLVNWWNLQCYAGGGSNRNDINQKWVKDINIHANIFGVSNGSAYIVPGFSTVGTVETVDEDFKAYAAGVVDGGFVWNWPDSEPTQLKEYSAAIVNGLNGK